MYQFNHSWGQGWCLHPWESRIGTFAFSSFTLFKCVLDQLKSKRAFCQDSDGKGAPDHSSSQGAYKHVPARVTRLPCIGETKWHCKCKNFVQTWKKLLGHVSHHHPFLARWADLRKPAKRCYRATETGCYLTDEGQRGHVDHGRSLGSSLGSLTAEGGCWTTGTRHPQGAHSGVEDSDSKCTHVCEVAQGQGLCMFSVKKFTHQTHSKFAYLPWGKGAERSVPPLWLSASNNLSQLKIIDLG